MTSRTTNEAVLITGGAGFIGTNVAKSYLSQGRAVHVFDNLSRAGVRANIAYMENRFGRQLRFTDGDVRDRGALQDAIANASTVIHLAAQVAVTTSLADPSGDLETNLLGTFNVIDCVRRAGRRLPVLFTSTNKVYGQLKGIRFRRSGDRWEPEDVSVANRGVDESQALDFLSPYGCSKGSADQYVLDYARSYDIPATVFRMSCIYGPHQLGTEDQGWVAHFVRRCIQGEPVTFYGDGAQVRDLLFVDDLVEAIRAAVDHIELTKGQPFNLGGGVGNSVSLLEVIRLIESILSTRVEVRSGDERLGDQKWYVADTGKIGRVLGWQPRTSVADGVARLVRWYEAQPSHALEAEVQVA